MRYRRLHAVSVLAVLALLAGACLPGDSGGESTPQEEAEGTATQSEPAAGEGTEAAAESFQGQTLTVWDVYARGAESEVVTQLVGEFEEEHGVTVEREARPLEDLQTTVGLALEQDDGPDVVSVNQGRADMGTFVEAGLLLDLSDFAEERGWTEDFGENLLARNRFTEDGQTFGEGNLYGIAPQAEVVGWYYDEPTFDELGLEVPQTFDELQQALATIEESGQTPIVFGNSEGWPAIHTYGAVEHVFTDTQYLNDFIFGLSEQSFDTPANVQAAEIVQDWTRQGYFTENFSGISYDDSWPQFAGGEGVTMLTGSWIAPELDQQTTGFFLTPGEDGELPPQIGGQGVPLAVRASTDVPDLAKEYIDFMVSERAAELWAEAGALPSRVPPEGTVPEGTLLADILAAWQTVIEQDQLGHYLDWASPTMYDTLVADLQSLFALETEPAQFVESVQSDYASANE